jgi:GntR family transcriptional regulator of arabinose operon
MVYKKLVDDLRKKIESNIFAPGMQLPSEGELCKVYGISRPSVRNALEKLEKLDLIHRKPGVGSFVGSKPSEKKSIINIGIDINFEGYMAEWYTAKIMGGIMESCQTGDVRFTFVDPTSVLNLPQGYIDGLICLKYANFELLSQVAASGIQVVLINRIPLDSQLGYIAVDYEKESRRAVEYLLSMGHERIGTFFDGQYVTRKRFDGYVAAHKTFGLEIDESLVLHHHDNREAAQRLDEFIRTRKPTALYSPLVAHLYPIYHSSLRMGFKIPEDLSVLCFDDPDVISQETGITFSGIKMPLKEMGKEALSYLAARVKMGSSIPVIRKIVEADLVIRNSCKFIARPAGISTE